jgi:outer membrane immunogenic protein
LNEPIKNMGRIMRQLLCTAVTAAAALIALSMTANAADVGADAPASVPPALYVPPSWTRLYLGANIGRTWGQGAVTDSLLGLSFGINALPILGGQLGFDYQIGIFAIGVEGDFDAMVDTNNGVVAPGVGTIQAVSEHRWITTVAARFGVTYDHWLFYSKVGGGRIVNNNFTFSNPATGASIIGFSGNSNNGLLAGAGIELVLGPHLSAKIEYDYLRLSSQTFTVPAGALLDTFTISNPNVQMVKVGLNYFFNWASSTDR